MADGPSRAQFINRELSWLEFNARVLHEALDERTPLLERLKFLAIFTSNLDEFYQVRVAGLRRQVAAGVTQVPADGMLPGVQLDAIDERVRELVLRQERCLHEEVLPSLAEHGIRLVGMQDLTAGERAGVEAFFTREVFPVLTPLGVDPSHPFPYISNLSLSLAVAIRDPDDGSERFARVKVPRSLPRWVPLGRVNHFLPLELLIGANLGALFPGMEVVGCHAFKITRFSDLDVPADDEPEDLLASIEEQVFQRRFGEVVRLEVQAGTPAYLRDLLLEELRESGGPDVLPLTARDVHEVGALVELSDLMTLATLEVPALRDTPYAPLIPPELRDPERSMFDVIRERDVLVHHPFESFAQSVERFFESAAADEHVLALKTTLYRTSGDTAMVRALTEAAQSGKQVAVLVELQARGDEANNINWARTLENYGVHVAYGLPGLKTHAKVALVVRRDPDGIRRYVHIGTGNYNSKTARIYTDIGLFTVDEEIAADISDVFNLLTGFSRQRTYRRLLVGPANMKERFLALIAREAAHARDGRPARVTAKLNALVAPDIIAALYDASRAGVEIELIVRGICCLRPGIEGVSERIRVRSIIGRFLEHSRVFHFLNGGDEEFYIGSADWMPRNLERRVEVITPVRDRVLQGRLRTLLDACLDDNRQAWELDADGRWTQRTPVVGEDEVAIHRRLLRDPWGSDRTSSRYATSEMRTVPLAEYDHATGNGKVRETVPRKARRKRDGRSRERG
ncbi:MAG: polyphosphate kinase 1 [Gemmatimonadaceae bacterium]|nr:polyphosphate kinase 1 [Gemmatimonadaceae bacterium]